MMLFLPFLVTAVAMAILFLYCFSNCDFIALIHPIQWTIANPVGGDRPTKRQKKTSCVSTGRPRRSSSALDT